MQAAKALRFIHTKNVIHSDFGSHNFLIQEDGSLALADFGGSWIDNISAAVSYSTRYARPCSDDFVSTEMDDLFALGTIIYENGVGQCCMLIDLAEKSGSHCTSMIFQIIRKCWSNGYQTSEEVIRNLETTPSSSYPHLFCFTRLSLGIVITVFVTIRRRSFWLS